MIYHSLRWGIINTHTLWFRCHSLSEQSLFLPLAEQILYLHLIIFFSEYFPGLELVTARSWFQLQRIPLYTEGLTGNCSFELF